eukprot:1891017-Pleurochrysis_carterae.AAC.4
MSSPCGMNCSQIPENKISLPNTVKFKLRRVKGEGVSHVALLPLGSVGQLTLQVSQAKYCQPQPTSSRLRFKEGLQRESTRPLKCVPEHVAEPLPSPMYRVSIGHRYVA